MQATVHRTIPTPISTMPLPTLKPPKPTATPSLHTKNLVGVSTPTHLAQNPPVSSYMHVANAVCPTTTSPIVYEQRQQISSLSSTEALPPTKPCTINVELSELLLADHPNRFLVDYMIDGLKNGFDIGFKGEAMATHPKNLKSASQNKEAIQQAIDKEVQRGHTAGPFPEPPFPITHCSPIGSAPKKDGSVRLIMDLSQPHGASINDFISKDQFSCEYSHFDEATDLINKLGKGTLMCKLDIKHAYRLLPVRPDQWHHLCYFWEGNYYVDLVLPFGLRSSGSIFNLFAKLVRWIVQHHYNIQNIINYSDDFFAALSKDMHTARQQLQTIIAAFHDLNIPLAEDKIEGPSTIITYLGIIINSLLMTIEIPEERYNDSLTYLHDWLQRRTCTQRQIKSLIGKLGFISKVVRPGRLFSRRLIDLSTTVKRLHHHITLNSEAKADIKWWLEFLPTWSSSSMIPPSNSILASDMLLFSDASDIGFGAIFGNAWIQGSWPTGKSKPSIAYRELFAITAAALTWGEHWHGKRIVFVTDNKSISQIWNTGTSPCPDIMSLIRPLYFHAAKFGYSVSFKHIFGASNPIADAISRFQDTKFRALMPNAATKATQLPTAVLNLIPPSG